MNLSGLSIVTRNGNKYEKLPKKAITNKMTNNSWNQEFNILSKPKKNFHSSVGVKNFQRLNCDHVDFSMVEKN